MSEKPAVTIDLSGMPCPAPLLGAKKIIDDLQPEQVLMLISDCPGTQDDLYSWCKYTGNEMRFRVVEQMDPERFKMLQRHAQQWVTRRFSVYEQLAKMAFPVVKE